MMFATMIEPLTGSEALITFDGIAGGENLTGIFEASSIPEGIGKFIMRQEKEGTKGHLSVLVKPMREAEILFVDDGLDILRKIVGGNIEITGMRYLNSDIISNEEGKILKLPANRALTDGNDIIYDIICGTFLIAGFNMEGDRTGLDPCDAVDAFMIFRFPELLAYDAGSKQFSRIRCPAEVARFIQQNSVSLIN